MVLLCCCAFGVAANWHTIACYVRYGNRVDLRRVEVVGINDDAYMIKIDGQRFETTDSHSLALAKWVGVFGGEDEPPEHHHQRCFAEQDGARVIYGADWE